MTDEQETSEAVNHTAIVEPRLRDLPLTLGNFPRICLLALIRLYQATFSRAMPPDTCRFYPSCSHYGYQAVYKYGAIRGGFMAAWRVLRCNPFNPGGFDPVPYNKPMKLKHIILSFISLLAFGLLTACAGGGSVVNSWPGMTVDAEQEVVYVAYNTYVHAINLANGTEKWRYPAKAENSKLFFAAPTLTQDGQLIVAGYNQVVYSLDPSSGVEKWTFDEAGNRYIAGPLVIGDKILAPSADGYLYALDLSGKLAWKYQTEHGQWGTPAADEQNVYLPSMDHRVHALDIATGKLIWKSDDLGGAVASQPVLDENGTLFVGTLLPEVVAIEKNSGKIVWRTATVGWVWASPVLKDGILYAADLSGTVYAMQASDGAILWKYQPVAGAKNAISSSPLILADKLYFVSENGSLYAVDLATGNPSWNKTFTAKLYVSPFAAGDKLLIAQLGAENLVVALDVNGNQIWTFVPGK